jgi:hypothetical protein
MWKMRAPAKELGCYIRPIGPDGSLFFWIEADLSEELDVLERFENFAPKVTLHVDLARKSIGEGGFKYVVMKIFDAGHNERLRVWLTD